MKWLTGLLTLVNGLLSLFQRERDRQAGRDAQQVAQAKADATARATADDARDAVARDPALRRRVLDEFRRD